MSTTAVFGTVMAVEDNIIKRTLQRRSIGASYRHNAALCQKISA
ncbi:hypothetical protein [Ruminococcus sp.]|nr:hypothetical protein [Ruminococcus sp.]